MGFRENLLKKIQIEELAQGILHSIDPQDSAKRMDREAMRRLLEMGPYQYRKERDLDLYMLNEAEILALDNELKIYRTTAEDIGLRKSPTVKEMVSFRNAIKILNDKDVVVSRKADTVLRIRSELVAALDLSFTAADIESLAADGSEALNNGYAEGVVEILSLFAELLHFQKAPKIFQVSHHQTWGALERPRDGEWRFGPLVMFDRMHNSLKMIETPVSSLDKGALEKFHQAAKSADYADLASDKVWQALQKAVLEKSAP
ncbi:MAG: hypothetical protein P8Z73_01760 [Desulfobacteraceae bacterium]|jgi:hypothetical protein